MEDGAVHPSDEGTPQGGSISLLLSNLYLHYVLDLWFERVVKGRLRGEAHLVRYIDDFVICFQYRSDALRVQDALGLNPQSVEEVLRQNRSFTFFRIVGLSDDMEAVGAQGVPLTSGRSIAIDNSVHVYGTPFFIRARLPLTNEKRTASFARLMIAQDTGSAIVGPARADIYLGAGDQAGQLAGLIHNSGHFAMLVPRELDPVATGAQMPLPPEKPPAAALISVRTSAQKSSTTCRIFGSPCAIAGRAEILTPDWRRKSLEQGLRTQSSLFPALRRRTLSPHQPSWSNLSAQ